MQRKAIFLAFAEESKNNKLMVTRTYQETITDALEACFSFRGLDLCDYLPETTLTEDLSYPDALEMAIEMEKKASKFYLDVAELSKSLLATIPIAFGKVARRRENRKPKLESLLQS